MFQMDLCLAACRISCSPPRTLVAAHTFLTAGSLGFTSIYFTVVFLFAFSSCKTKQNKSLFSKDIPLPPFASLWVKLRAIQARKALGHGATTQPLGESSHSLKCQPVLKLCCWCNVGTQLLWDSHQSLSSSKYLTRENRLSFATAPLVKTDSRNEFILFPWLQHLFILRENLGSYHEVFLPRQTIVFSVCVCVWGR